MKRRVPIFILFFGAEIFLILAAFYLIIYFKNLPEIHTYVALFLGIYLFVRALVFIIIHSKTFTKINYILSIINDFKKGKFIAHHNNNHSNNSLSLIIKELSVMGRNLDSVLNSQKSEISKLRELYQNIVLSISSFFIVLNEKGDIIFANESFCKKFQFDLEDIIGKKIDSIFIFVTPTIKESIKSVLTKKEPIIIEKTHLLSSTSIAIVADIKISSMIVEGETQVILIIDDITAICKKDFQMNLISQVSETIQRDDEIESVLHAILIGVTSGSGLGFNRAMLFLIDNKEKKLVGKMAVGPDTMEEAIQIWSSVSACGIDIYSQLKSYQEKNHEKSNFINLVLNTSFSLKDTTNIFVQACHNQEYIHVYDAYNDPRISEEIRDFMGVKEFVVIPLISMNKSIGVIVADNKFNQAPIGQDSIDLLSIFAFQAALLIESYNNLHIIKKEMEKIQEKQEALIESEKLAAVGRIAAHIAHEIRNPLVTMGGYARRIIQLAKDTKEIIKNQDHIIKSASVVLKESERLEKTLSNVMDFSRTSSFIMEFNNINEIVLDTFELLKNLFQERRINCKLNLSEELPLVKSDFNQMKQVMLNLIQNAIDATPPQGEICISTKSNGQNVYISVKDTGIGIPPEDLNKIFEPFYSTKVTGVGLGLSIIKKIINDHNGDIAVTSSKEEGTEFVVKLPLPK
ncbi:MAG: ATP-binding protein [Spirochaetes bacterium]|nr:ATP-binding protein [Spirochaetota bacterium]